MSKVKMSLWEKIKCFFGLCKVNEEALIELYNNVKPNVKTVKEDFENTILKVKDEFGEAGGVVIDKIGDKIEDTVETTVENITNKVEETKKRVKRQWFNNGKVQKLVPIEEINKLTRTWKKGKLKTPKKGK